MNKKALTGINATLIGAYSQLLHIIFKHCQFEFDGSPAFIGIAATILTYGTTLLILWLNPPDVLVFGQKVKIKSAIKKLNKRNLNLPESSPDRQANNDKIRAYQKWLDDIDEQEIQKLMTNQETEV
ncbi:MAG: hypothetical protein ACFNUA_05000 [Haemophilus parainfluenzae]|jgi:hypothetical protein